MIHLGDITKISGYTAPIVDCVVGGSPCQDLSVAGKRAGLDGERSGLFMDQVRIVKEMRDRDVRENGRSGVDVRPRYLVWENVPGAFSSNKGEDFRIVLEEIARVKDQDAVIPQPDKWQTSGCILGDGWSIAWRVLDAQFWGVPQRRRRIALVADFGGHSASEILFVSNGVCGDTKPSQPKGKATSHDATGCTGADDTAYTMKIRSGCDVDANGKAAGKGALIQTEKSGTLSCVQDQYLFQPVGADQYNAVILGDSVSTLGVNCGMSHGRQCVLEPVIYDARGNGDGKTSCNLTSRDEGSVGDYSNLVLHTAPVYSVENHPADSRVDIDDSGKVQTLTSRMGTGGGNVPMVMEPAVFSKSKRAQNPTDYETWQESDTANTLNAFDTGDVRTNECVIALDRASYNQGKNAQYDFDINDGGIASTIVAKGPSAVYYTVDQGGGKSACNVQEGQAPTLTCTHGGEPAVCYSLDPLSSNSMKSSNPHSGCHETDVARTIDTTYPDPSKNQGGVAVVEQVHIIGNGQADQTYLQEKAGTLNCMHDQQAVMIASSGCRTRYTVRRLTPLECERLQGYPDGWTDIGEYIDSNGKKKKSSDAARYKALGNSIAIPPWKWVMKRLCACYERDATLGSLFDGISGFVLIWSQLNGLGSVKWTSEIDEFPMAVCKRHFGDEATGERGDFYEAIL